MAPAILAALLTTSVVRVAAAVDNARLVSMSVASNASVMPRSMFTEVFTVQNTGTTTWTATPSGYTCNLTSWDRLGALPAYTNTDQTWYTPNAIIGSGNSVLPGQTAAFTMHFIAPEAPGSVTDTFQLNNADGDYFGPVFAVQVNVLVSGNTNQYDRCRAVSYANNYAGFIVGDGYFWTNGSGFYYFGTNVGVPTAYLGDDCAHFVSSCIGRQPTDWGGGIYIPSRVPPTYGEPGAARLVNTVLIQPGYAVEVQSLDQMEPGDVIGWNWEGDTDINDLDHVTIYLGNGMLASHAISALDVSADYFFQGNPPNAKDIRHLVHIYDAPTLGCTTSGTNMVLSWGTNWSSYQLQYSSSLAAGAKWTKAPGTIGTVGAMHMMTNSMSQGTVFYKLTMP